MFDWFKRQAPIPCEVQGIARSACPLGICGVAATALCRDGNDAVWSYDRSTCFVGAATTVIVAGKLICDPYVDTVVRMEGLAAGDLDSHIAYSDHSDCVGRMVAAMGTFRDNAQVVAESSKVSHELVEVLGNGLHKLADGDLSYRITSSVPKQYELLRDNFNSAMSSLSEVLGSVTQASRSIHAGAGRNSLSNQRSLPAY